MLLGNGDGTFQPQVTYAVGLGPRRHRGGRLHRRRPHRPGRRERRTINTVSVLLGNGDGTFQPQVTYAVGSSPDAIVAGDFTGDGRTDLAVANDLRRHACRCCWATATAPSSPRSPTRSGSTPDAIVAGDFNGDGRTDLAVANDVRRHACRCCWATATAPSSPRSPTRWASNPDAIVAGDFTGDGRTDLAVANVLRRHACRCCWATATAPSSPRSPTRWARTQTPSWRATSTATAALDLAVANEARLTRVSVLLGNGDGTFQPQVTYAVGVGSRRDRGGRLQRRRPHSTWPSQMRAFDYSGTVSVLLGNGDGTFQPQVTYAVGRRIQTPSWRATSTATAASTWPSQTICTTNTVSVLLGNGDGTFQPQVTYAVGLESGRDRGGRLQRRRPHRPGRRKRRSTTPCRCCWATATARSSPRSPTRWGRSRRDRGGRLQRRRPHRPGRRKLDLATPCRCCWATATAPSSPRSPTRWGSVRTRSWRATSTATAAPTWPSQTTIGRHRVGAAGQRRRHVFRPRTVRHRLLTPHPWWPTSTATAPRMSWSSMRPATSSTARASPASPAPSSPPSRSTPALRRATSPGFRTRIKARCSPASMLDDNAVSLYAYRDGGFVQVGSLATGLLPAQIIAADLNGDGLTDLVVRNAGDGTLSVFLDTGSARSINPSVRPPILPGTVTLPVGLGVSDVQAIDTTGSGRLDLVVTNKLTGQVEHPAEPGQRDLRAHSSPIAPGPGCPRSTPAPARPRSPAWRPRPAWPPGRSRRAGRPTW